MKTSFFLVLRLRPWNSDIYILDWINPDHKEIRESGFWFLKRLCTHRQKLAKNRQFGVINQYFYFRSRTHISLKILFRSETLFLFLFPLFPLFPFPMQVAALCQGVRTENKCFTSKYYFLFRAIRMYRLEEAQIVINFISSKTFSIQSLA